MDTIGARLRAERKRLGLSQEAFAALADASKPSQVRYENGERYPDGQFLSRIAEHGADVLYILTGEHSAASLPRSVLQNIQQSLSGPADFVPVPVYAAELAAGSGVVNLGGEEITEHLAFRQDWLKRIGVIPSKAVLARIADGELGRSMIPTIHPRDLVLINTATREIPRHHGTKAKAPIYAFTTDHGTRVKRVSVLDDTVILTSDNPEFSPELVPADQWDGANVIGEVMWWGHTNRE